MHIQFTVYACLNLIGLYHDSLLEKKRKSQEAAELDSQNAGTSLMASAMATMTPFNRYTRSIMQSSPTYRRLAYTLTLLQFTEVFVEMAVRKRCGQRAKWKCVFALEAVKYGLCTLMLMANSIKYHQGLLVVWACFIYRMEECNWLQPFPVSAAHRLKIAP